MARGDLDDIAEKERINRELGRIISQLSEDELAELLRDEEIIITNMPNDQNYIWSEEDVLQDTKIFNFKRIKAVKFSDPLVQKLQPRDISEYFLFKNIEEAKLEAEYGMAFLVYKYSQIHKKTPGWIYLTSEVLKKDFFEKFIKEMKFPITSFIASYHYNNKKADIVNFWCNLGEIFIYYDGNGFYILFPPEFRNFQETQNELGIILGIIKAYKTPKVVKNKIYIVYRGQYGFDKKDFTLKRIKNINLETNYNEGFDKVSHDIVTKLNNKKKTGLIILHGIPGTGKTTYIRYLAGKLKRNIIFISTDMVHHITEPEFIPFLMDNSDAILILEDAEAALQKRDASGRTGAVSNILNLTDGLLSDCLNISIVATFNTETKNIDEALLRKGRLLKAYKFEKLAIDKSKALMIKEGFDSEKVTKPMTLADIYNFEDDIKGNPEAFTETKKIGFNQNQDR
jgi:flagellar biosynthesis GTPase FlhF